MRIRSIARKTFLELAAPFAIPKNGIYMLNGHHLCREGAPDSALFYKQLKALRRHYDFVNFEDALELIDDVNGKVFNERLIAFTFDDGFVDCISSIAPTLCDFGVNACFFINSGFIDSADDYQADFTMNKVHTPGKRPMSWDQVKSLDANGFVIGNHTRDHLRLSGLCDFEFMEQIEASNGKIESVLGKKCNHFAWPYGALDDVTERQVDMLRSMYRYVFSGDDYINYFSYSGKVYNRRHFEPFWPASHVKYFLSKGKR